MLAFQSLNYSFDLNFKYDLKIKIVLPIEQHAGKVFLGQTEKPNRTKKSS